MTLPLFSSYREIPLTQGQVALVDECDYERLMQWKWYAAFRANKFYAQRHAYFENGTEQTIYLHRVVLEIDDGDPIFVDHINLNGLDNRRENLRRATHAQNQLNTRPRGKSGFKGVYWQKEAKKWQATIYVNGRNKSLGYFHSPEDARDAYNAVARELLGEFSRF